MPNRTYALEWLFLANRNLETANLLFSENHYTDIIAIEIHHTVEKTIKAILAFNGLQIPRIHSLPELFELCNSYLNLNDISIENLF